MDERGDHNGHSSAQRRLRPALLCISPSFAPATTPTAIRAGKLLERLSGKWDITVLTETGSARRDAAITVEPVPSRRPRRLLQAIRRLRLSKLLELGVWPDESIFWVVPAVFAARRVLKQRRHEAIVVFMMPYSAGLAGVALRRLTGLPLVLNLDDSPTCTDMHPHFPSRLHYRLARRLEDFYLSAADAVVYVSQSNLDAVAERQPEGLRGKLNLVRYGADPGDFAAGHADGDSDFHVAYVGAMSGWWSLIEDDAPNGALKRAYDIWSQFGRYERLRLDQRTSSPAVIGAAVQRLIAAHPAWAGRVRVDIYGNPYPADVVARALAGAGVEDVVSVSGPVAHEQVASLLAGADLLFLTLPRRLDGSRGGRISAKTYEYLMTDRPILAALPRGENWDFLAGKPGVWLVDPDDASAMTAVLSELAAAKFDGRAQPVDRRALREELSYAKRTEEFAAVIRAVLSDGRVGRDRASGVPR